MPTNAYFCTYLYDNQGKHRNLVFAAHCERKWIWKQMDLRVSHLSSNPSSVACWVVVGEQLTALSFFLSGVKRAFDKAFEWVWLHLGVTQNVLITFQRGKQFPDPQCHLFSFPKLTCPTTSVDEVWSRFSVSLPNSESLFSHFTEGRHPCHLPEVLTKVHRPPGKGSLGHQRNKWQHLCLQCERKWQTTG